MAKNDWILPAHSNVTNKVDFTLAGTPCMTSGIRLLKLVTIRQININETIGLSILYTTTPVSVMWEIGRRLGHYGDQGHREFTFGNSRELDDPKIPAGIPGNSKNCHLQFFWSPYMVHPLEGCTMYGLFFVCLSRTVVLGHCTKKTF